MARRPNPFLTLSMPYVDESFVAEAEDGILSQIHMWLTESDPQWRSMLRDHLKDDVLWLRAWRAAYARNTTLNKEAA